MNGSVVKKAGNWYVIIERRDPATAEHLRKWHSGFRTKRSAEAARAELVSAANRGEYVASSKQALGNYLTDVWLPTIRGSVRGTTYARYEGIVRTQIMPRIGSSPLQELEAPSVNLLYQELLHSGRVDGSGGFAPNSVRNIHVVLHKSLADAVRWGILRRNPADYADPPRPRQMSEMSVWSADQVRQFLAATQGTRLHAVWALAVLTGLRRGELLGLRWSDVNLSERFLSVRRAVASANYAVTVSEPKTRRGARRVELDDWTIETLSAHRRRQSAEKLALGPAYEDSDWVFATENGSLTHPDRLSKMFQDRVKASGLPRIRLHDLRHTHATLALEAGSHPKVVSERLGHATVAITLDLYSHVSPSLQRDVAELVSNAVRSNAVENR